MAAIEPNYLFKQIEPIKTWQTVRGVSSFLIQFLMFVDMIQAAQFTSVPDCFQIRLTAKGIAAVRDANQ